MLLTKEEIVRVLDFQKKKYSKEERDTILRFYDSIPIKDIEGQALDYLDFDESESRSPYLYQMDMLELLKIMSLPAVREMIGEVTVNLMIDKIDRLFFFFRTLDDYSFDAKIIIEKVVNECGDYKWIENAVNHEKESAIKKLKALGVSSI